MQQIEQFIKEIPMLTSQQRAKLREAAAKCIAGTHDMPQDAPAYICEKKWHGLRAMCMQERYAAKVAGQTWSAGKDQAFKSHAGGGKPSVILAYRSWRT